MSISPLFPMATDLSCSDHLQLVKAYDAASEVLIVDYGVTADKISAVSRELAVAILTLYRAGQRDEVKLGRYAASQAISHVRH